MTAPTRPAAESAGELAVPLEHRARLMELEQKVLDTWAVRKFYEARTDRAVQKARWEWQAIRAYKKCIDAIDAHSRACLAWQEFLNHILPDTLVGQWNLDRVRMVVTQKQTHHPLAALFGQQP